VLIYLAGYLCLMDATHQRNSSGWKLTTVLVRTGYEFFLEKENSRTVALGLTEIRKMLQPLSLRWEPRYFVLDQSQIEVKALRYAFPGLDNGEQEITVYYCFVHLMRTLMKKSNQDLQLHTSLCSKRCTEEPNPVAWSPSKLLLRLRGQISSKII
jgi:hypothetical protein